MASRATSQYSSFLRPPRRLEKKRPQHGLARGHHSILSTILPKTWRLSMRSQRLAVPSKPISRSDYRVNQAGRHLEAWRFPCSPCGSRREPKILICCWKSCIRLMLVEDARGRSRR